MKKILFLILLLCSAKAIAQFTSVTATIVDSDSQTWNNCKWNIQWKSNGSQTNPNLYNINGVSITSNTYSNYLNQSGSCNGSGILSLTALDNSLISPAGSQWVFTIQSNTSAPATQYLPLSLTGASVNLNSYLSLNSIVPRIKIGNQAGIYAYADVEITNQTCGNFYWNVVAAQSRTWNCNTNAWQTSVTSTWDGGTVLNPITAPQITTKNINGEINLSQYLGAGDLAQAFSTAYALWGQSHYRVPYLAGGYSITHTLALTPQDDGTLNITCDPGTEINYTGTGEAVTILGSGQSRVGEMINGCWINNATGTSTAGLHIRALNGLHLTNVKITNFTSGDGLFNEGSNSTESIGLVFSGNKNNIHEVGVVVSGTNYSPNGNNYIGGINANASQYGVWEDPALSSTVGPNQINRFLGIKFETNTLHVFIQRCDSCVVTGNYFENASTKVSHIQVGDASNSPNNTVIDSNFMATNNNNLTQDVLNYGYKTNINNNLDASGSTTTYFVFDNSAASETYVGANVSGAVNYTGGTVSTYAEIHNSGNMTIGGQFLTGQIIFGGGFGANGGGPNCAANLAAFGVTPSGTIITSCGPDGTTHGPFIFRSATSTGTFNPVLSIDGTGNISNVNGEIIPSGVNNFHGSSGTQIQLSDGTGSPSNYVKFASDGSITNGPVSTTIPLSGTGGSGATHAACIITNGPPTQIGHCTSQPDASGICTCVAN